MRKNRFAIAGRGFDRDSIRALHTGTMPARVRPSRGGRRVRLRLTWRRDPLTGRVAGSWQALPAKQGAQRVTRAVISPTARGGAGVAAA